MSKKRDQLRPIKFVRNFTKHAAGSVLVKWGDTWVLCTASVEEKVPPFLKGTGKGWVTAEYAMLPASTTERKKKGRHQEGRPERGNTATDRPGAAAGGGPEGAG